MASRRKIVTLARQLFKLSFEDGRLSEERVAGVLAWVDKHRPPDATTVLRRYKRLAEAELARHRAVIEFAGEISPALAAEVAAAMSQRYGRPIEPVAVASPALIAGVRVRVASDIYENSIASQLASLSRSA